VLSDKLFLIKQKTIANNTNIQTGIHKCLCIANMIMEINLISKLYCLFVCLMLFNSTFNNISAMSWQLVLLVEETGGPRENYRPVASH
jgi:hypothetical protein